MISFFAKAWNVEALGFSFERLASMSCCFANDLVLTFSQESGEPRRLIQSHCFVDIKDTSALLLSWEGSTLQALTFSR